MLQSHQKLTIAHYQCNFKLEECVQLKSYGLFVTPLTIRTLIEPRLSV